MNNWVLNTGIIFETCLAAFMCYCPGELINWSAENQNQALANLNIDLSEPNSPWYYTFIYKTHDQLFTSCNFLILLLIPGLDLALRTYPLNFTWWLPALPFSLIIWVYDEARRALLRKYPGGTFLVFRLSKIQIPSFFKLQLFTKDDVGLSLWRWFDDLLFQDGLKKKPTTRSKRNLNKKHIYIVWWTPCLLSIHGYTHQGNRKLFIVN